MAGGRLGGVGVNCEQTHFFLNTLLIDIWRLGEKNRVFNIIISKRNRIWWRGGLSFSLLAPPIDGVTVRLYCVETFDDIL